MEMRNCYRCGKTGKIAQKKKGCLICKGSGLLPKHRIDSRLLAAKLKKEKPRLKIVKKQVWKPKNWVIRRFSRKGLVWYSKGSRGMLWWATHDVFALRFDTIEEAKAYAIENLRPGCEVVFNQESRPKGLKLEGEDNKDVQKL